jgi:hypothetical protein
LLILDLQMGRSTVAAEVQAVEPYLRRPYVHLALDPEFTMGPNEVPGKVIGSLDAAPIGATIRLLDALVEANNLPPKLLIVHRFTQGMLTNPHEVRPTRRVQVVVTMDGWGVPATKIDHYREYVGRQGIQFSGFKLFHLQDQPVMSPAEVLSLEPPPDVIIYQ